MNKLPDYIGSAGTVLISGHIRPDGDCVGSCLGMYNYIRDNFPDVSADVRLEQVPESYMSVPGADKIITGQPDDRKYDLFIALDASDRGRLGQADVYFDRAVHTVCIDHHVSNSGYAEYNVILPDASSASEVLCDLLESDKISYNTAYALYTGIICDSGVFKYNCTSSHTMEVAGMLMDKGIPYTDIINDVFYEKTFLQNRVMGYCLLNSELLCGGRLIWCYLSRGKMDEFGADHSDLEGIVSQMKLTKGTEVSAFVTGTGSGDLRLSMRSSGIVDVRKIAGKYGGGGHTLAAGATVDTDIDSLRSEIERMVEEQL